METNCMSGEPMSKPMTIPELHAAVRALVPKNFTTFVDLSVKVYSHRPDETDVVVSVWVQPSRCDSQGYAVDGDTCEQVLEQVRSVVLPRLGLVDVPPAEQRLAAMAAEPPSLVESMFNTGLAYSCNGTAGCDGDRFGGCRHHRTGQFA